MSCLTPTRLLARITSPIACHIRCKPDILSGNHRFASSTLLHLLHLLHTTTPPSRLASPAHRTLGTGPYTLSSFTISSHPDKILLFPDRSVCCLCIGHSANVRACSWTWTSLRPPQKRESNHLQPTNRSKIDFSCFVFKYLRGGTKIKDVSRLYFILLFPLSSPLGLEGHSLYQAPFPIHSHTF